MCTNCMGGSRSLWAIGPPYPKLEQVEAGTGVVLGRCIECGQLWLECMYEPFAAFRYAVKWRGSIEQFRISRDRDQSISLCQWHEAEVRFQGNGADPETLEHIRKHYERSRGNVDLRPSSQPNLPMMAGSEFTVRRARVEDAEALVQLHYDAVHVGARSDYAPQVLDSWSPPPDERRYAWMRSQIEASRHHVLLAEATNAAVIGFCMYAPAEGLIQAVYVASGWARMGVGRALMRLAEEGIAERGTAQARLNASRNALQFYLAEGYEVVAATTQPLADGTWMECHEMRKNLPTGSRQ